MKEKYKGIIYIMIAALCFSIMGTFVRLSGDIPSIQKSFFRNIAALVFAMIILKKNNVHFSRDKKNLGLLFIRATCGTIGILCNFYAVDHLVLADATILNKMSPFFAIIVSYFMLREKVNLVQVLSVIGAFVGCLFIVKPSGSMDIFPAMIGLLGGFASGVSYTMVRALGQRGEKGPFIVFFFSMFSCLVVLPYVIFNYTPMSAKQFIYLILAGLAASGGQFGITAAYCYAPAKEISIFDYSQVLFSAIIGFFVFGQIPDQYSFIGYLLVCGMALFMFLYNTGKLKNKKAAIKRE